MATWRQHCTQFSQQISLKKTAVHLVSSLFAFTRHRKTASPLVVPFSAIFLITSAGAHVAVCENWRLSEGQGGPAHPVAKLPGGGGG